MMRAVVALFFCSFNVSILSAQAPDVAGQVAAYQAERKAVEARATKEQLATADELVRKAQESSSPARAMKIIREARWRLPLVPNNLPEHVPLILGGMRLRHSDRINSIAYGKDGLTLLSGSRDGTVRLWDLQAGKEKWIYRELGMIVPTADTKVQDDVFKIAGVAVSPDGQMAAAVGYSEVHVLKMTDGSLIKALKKHKGQVRTVAFTKDGKRLATVGEDQQLCVWSIPDGELVFQQDMSKLAGPGNKVGRYEAIAASPKNSHVAITNADGKIVVYDIGGEKAVLRQSATITNSGTAVYCVKFTPDGTGFITGSEDSTPPRLSAAPPADGPPANPAAGTLPAVRSFVGVKNRTTGLDISPDGTLLVTGGGDTIVRVWEISSGKQLKQFSAHTTEVIAVACSPDGSEVATADDAGIIRLWPLAANDEHQSTEQPGTVWAIAAAPGGKRFAIGGADRVVRIFDYAKAEPVKQLTGHTGAIGAVAFLDENTVASGGGDRGIRVWNLSADGSPKTLSGHTSVILSLAGADGGKRLYSGSLDRRVLSWDVATGKTLASYDAKSAVCAIASYDKKIVIGTADGWVSLLDADKPAEFKLLYSTGAHTSGVAAVAFSPDGQRVASVGGDGTMKLFDVTSKGMLNLKSTVEAVMNTSTNTPFALSAVAFSPDGKQAAYAGQEGLIRLFDAIKNRETRSLRGHRDWVSGLTFADNGLAVCSVGVDQSVRRFPLTQDNVAPVAGHIRAANSVAVSPDGKSCVTIGPDEMKVWDLATGRETATFPSPSFRVNVIIMVKNDEFLCAGDSEKLNWYSLKNGQRDRAESVGGSQIYSVSTNGTDIGVWQLRSEATEFVAFRNGQASPPYRLPGEKEPEKKVLSATISPDATLALAAQSDKMVQVVDMTTRKRVGELWKLYDADPVDLTITPDKSKVITIDSAGSVQVATIADRKVVGKGKAHENGCNGIFVARSGDRFATLGVDGKIIAWDMAAKELRSWTLPTDVKTMTLSPDGRKIIAINADGTAYVLAVP